MRRRLSFIAFAAVFACGAAAAQDKIVRIGVLTDLSGPYADIAGPGSVLAVEMAAEESGLRERGWSIEVISADHQNKPDVATAIVRRWADVDQVDAIVDLNSSGVALAANSVIVEKNRIHLNGGAASSSLTGKACTPNTIHWTYDSYAVANGTGRAVTENGGDSWYFIAADYVFGASLEADTSAVVIRKGGKILGHARHPLNNPDFSSALLQAQASGAKVVGLADGGADMVNAVKQASEFGVGQNGQKVAALLAFISDVHALGLPVAKGLALTETFYWDLNDDTRAFSRRFAERAKSHAKPTMVQAGDYSATLHYLKALAALGGNPHDGVAVVAKMKEIPTEDAAFGKGYIRPDGRKIHPAYLFEVKAPEESTEPWDYYKLVATIPAEEAFRPLAESECPLVRPAAGR